MLKLEQTLKSRSYSNSKDDQKDQKPELNKTQTKDDKEKLRRHSIMKGLYFGGCWFSLFLSYLPTPPLGRDMTQGQFLSRV